MGANGKFKQIKNTERYANQLCFRRNLYEKLFSFFTSNSKEGLFFLEHILGVFIRKIINNMIDCETTN
jgi:hypothetical protein